MALSDAKGDVDDRVRDLAASERELEKADFDLRYKTHEAKIVNKAAVAKRTEVGEVPPVVPLGAESAFAMPQTSVHHSFRLRLQHIDESDFKTACVEEFSKPGSCFCTGQSQKLSYSRANVSPSPVMLKLSFLSSITQYLTLTSAKTELSRKPSDAELVLAPCDNERLIAKVEMQCVG